jgi:DUF438 domain-containing protein
MIKQIFTDLHNGRSVEEVKAHFNALIGKITVDEISQVQHDFTQEGTLPAEEVKRLYAAHTALFKGSIEEEQRSQHPEEQPGHPVHTFKLENRELEKLIKTNVQIHLWQFEKEDSPEHVFKLLEDCNLLLDIDKQFNSKEHLIFPYL